MGTKIKGMDGEIEPLIESRDPLSAVGQGGTGGDMTPLCVEVLSVSARPPVTQAV